MCFKYLCFVVDLEIRCCISNLINSYYFRVLFEKFFNNYCTEKNDILVLKYELRKIYFEIISKKMELELEVKG